MVKRYNNFIYINLYKLSFFLSQNKTNISLFLFLSIQLWVFFKAYVSPFNKPTFGPVSINVLPFLVMGSSNIFILNLKLHPQIHTTRDWKGIVCDHCPVDS